MKYVKIDAEIYKLVLDKLCIIKDFAYLTRNQGIGDGIDGVLKDLRENMEDI